MSRKPRMTKLAWEAASLFDLDFTDSETSPGGSVAASMPAELSTKSVWSSTFKSSTNIARSDDNFTNDIFSFFGLNYATPEEFLYQNGDHMKEHAWLGDSLLDSLVCQFLWTKDQSCAVRSLGDLSQSRSKLVSNKFLAHFMTEECGFRHPNHEASEHTLGTVFEALLCLCAEKNGICVAQQAIKRYAEYCFKCTLWNRFRITSGSFLLDIAESKFNAEYFDMEENQYEGLEEGVISSTVKSSLEKICSPKRSCPELRNPLIDAAERKRSEIFMAKLAEDVNNEPTINLTCFKPKVASDRLEHSKDLLTFTWYSRKGNMHEETMFPCCGFRESDSPIYCNVVAWKDRTKQHPGNLRQDHIGSRKQGGGIAPRGSVTDHVPRMILPRWTCCGKYSVEEGCSGEQC